MSTCNSPIVNSRIILKMLEIQKHRGPDDSGIRAFSLKTSKSLELPVNEPVTIQGEYEGMLGFNRLSILDLSINGHQPMASPDQKVLLTMNGEIYNAFDFKNELINWGYQFKSTTDTEIVLALYLKYGFEEMLTRLNGMFAIVITDLRCGKLYVARDRFGIKPMYYIANSEMLAFSSELKSFRYLEGFTYRLDESQLDEFMLFRSNLRDTLFKDIHSLDPGHFLLFENGKELQKHCYFDINDFDRYHKNDVSLASLVAQFESLLGKSVQSQLMSDVKLGCQLSGGIDSSLITYFANNNTLKGQFESVSIVFDNLLFSEEKYIDRVNNQLNISGHKFLLGPEYYLKNIEKATWHFEAPLNHPNTIGIYLLSQRAKEHVTVLLSGEGADEVFGGYRRFSDISYPWSNRKFLHEIRNSIAQPGNLFSYFNDANRGVMANCFADSLLAAKLIREFNMAGAITSRKTLYNKLTGSAFDKQIKYEMLSFLPELLLRQDKMSMAHSIENRVPFLDNDVVSNSFNIPQKYLISRFRKNKYITEKYLLKEMAVRKFDKNFAFRNKVHFSIPLSDYFKNSQFKQYFNDKIIPGIRSRGIMNHSLISGWMDNISELHPKEIGCLWVAITFEIWASLYLDLQHENSHS